MSLLAEVIHVIRTEFIAALGCQTIDDLNRGQRERLARIELLVRGLVDQANAAASAPFRVIDVKTMEPPDLESIALNEQWARGTVYCDMEGFAKTEDGSLVLLDECGNVAYVPEGRFILEPVVEATHGDNGQTCACGD